MGPDRTGNQSIDSRDVIAELFEYGASISWPIEPIDIVEWSERLIIPRKINKDEPGPLSWDGREFAMQLLRWSVDPRVRVLVVCAPPQLIKTFFLVVRMLYVADQMQVPQLYVTSIRDKQTEFVEDKLKPIIEATPSLSEKLLRDGTGAPDRRFYKETKIRLGGADINLTYAGSASQLASTTTPEFIGDEPAKWRNDFKNEGGAVGLAEKRVKAFPETSKIIFVSTPPQVIDEENEYWNKYLSGTQHHFEVPCPNCGEFYEMRISPEDIDKQKVFYLAHAAKEKKNLTEVERTGHMVCPSCDHKISDRDKAAMVKAGEYRARNESPDPGIVSVRMRRLIQPGVRFGRYLADWMIAARREKTMMDFLLQEECQPWRPPNERVKVSELKHLLGNFEMGKLPEGHEAKAVIITADVQELKIPWTTWAVAEGEAWLLNYGDAIQESDIPEIARNAAESVGLEWIGGGIDCSYRSRDIYMFCLENQTMIPMRGRDMQKVWQLTADFDAERGKKKSARAKKWEDGKLQVLFWQNWDWKCSLYERTLKHKEGFEPPLKLWLPSDIGKHKRFLKEITAERVVTPKRGKPLWSKIQHRENDLGDCVLEMMVYLDFRRGMISPKRKTSLAALPTGRAGW